MIKLWMHISDEEQLKRFEKREKDPLKSWKLTDEDWRNREKRPQYEEAVEEMLERTDHDDHVLALDLGQRLHLRDHRCPAGPLQPG